MGLPEQTKELLQIVGNADEEAMGKIIAFARRLTGEEASAEEAVKRYEKRAADFFASGEKGLSKEESLEQLRRLLQ